MARKGDAVSFEVTASGGITPYSYQWQTRRGLTGSWSNVTYLSGKMSFFASDADLANPNYYRCVITDNAGTKVTSDAVYVSSASEALKVSLTYGSIEVYATDTFNVSVNVSGGKAPYKYQWYYGQSIGNYNAINENSQTIYFRPNPSPSVQYLKCTVIDANGAIAESAPFRITLKTAASNLSAKLNKTAVSVRHGENFSITVNPTGGTAPYQYSWYMAIGNGSFFDMSAYDPYASSQTFTAAGDITNPIKSFKCSVKDNSGNTVFSDVCVVTVTGTQQTLKATLNKTAVSVRNGESFSITVNPTGGTAPYQYTWYMAIGSGVFFDLSMYTPNANNQTFTAVGDITEPIESFKCSVRDNSGNTVFSDVCVVTVTGTQESLKATLSKTFINAEKNKPLTLSVNATGGTAPYTYKWYFGDSNGTFTDMTTYMQGATGSSITATPDPRYNTQYLKCLVTDRLGNTVYSNTCTIYVGYDPLKAELNCSSVYAPEGASYSVTCTPSGGLAPYYYEWVGEVYNGSQVVSSFRDPNTGRVFEAVGLNRGYRLHLLCRVYDSDTNSVQTKVCIVYFE